MSCVDTDQIIKLVVGTALLFGGAYVLALLLGVLLSIDITAVPWLFWCLAALVVVMVVLAWLKTRLDRIEAALIRIDRRGDEIESALEKVSR